MCLCTMQVLLRGRRARPGQVRRYRTLETERLMPSLNISAVMQQVTMAGKVDCKLIGL